MKRSEHSRIIAHIVQGTGGSMFRDELVAPKRPVVGTYQPDILRYLIHPRRVLDLIIEVEASEFTKKDVPGACLLADNLAEREESTERPMLCFVLPDGASVADFSHVEERLNIATGRMRKVLVAPAMRAREFVAWLQGRRTADEAKAIPSCGPAERFG